MLGKKSLFLGLLVILFLWAIPVYAAASVYFPDSQDAYQHPNGTVIDSAVSNHRSLGHNYIYGVRFNDRYSGDIFEVVFSATPLNITLDSYWMFSQWNYGPRVHSASGLTGEPITVLTYSGYETSGNTVYVLDRYFSTYGPFAKLIEVTPIGPDAPENVNIDKTKPTTTISLDGPVGNNGWYRSGVKVSLSSTDDGSGIAKTEYSLDGLNWNTYSSTFIISTEGNTTVYYRSIDQANNVEDVKQQIIQIDKSPPSVTTSVQKFYALNSTLLVEYDAEDTVSGISTIAAILNGNPVDKGTLRALTNLGTNKLEIVATDNAGNVQTLIKTFEVYLPVKLSMDQKEINLKAQGVITAFLSLPSLYSTPPIANSVNLNGVVATIENLNNPSHLVFKFRRSELSKVVPTGEGVTFTLTGYTGTYYIRGITEVSVY